jgi:F0F1-type ATP synthase alpha subunit
MESIKANEINEIIRQQIENFDTNMTVSEVGTGYQGRRRHRRNSRA